MSILGDLQDSAKTALKAGDRERVSALRMIINELQKEEKQSREGLDQDTELAVLRRELKRREESVEAFRAGGRDDLARAEELAISIITDLLPQQMDEDELGGLVDRVVSSTGATSVRDMGKVMAAIMAEGGVRVDGKLASRRVKERLS